MSIKNIFRKKPINQILTDNSDLNGGHQLKKILTFKDLTLFGIAAIIGAGSFSSLGSAVFHGGPGVVWLFVITAIACGFTALCYSEFASRIPVSGSAYTYAYASFGELFAWIIGWALIMEYSIGNIYVSFSWSDYFTSFLSKCGIHFPSFLSESYFEVKHAIAHGTSNGDILSAWNQAPLFYGIKIIFDLPAIVINILITYLVFRGVKESKNLSNIMVYLKLVIIFLVLLIGGYFIFKLDLTGNWLPLNSEHQPSFMPNGFGGIMSAISGVFFAYIGFDAVSVLAEESKDPQRDLPRGMMWSLVICTLIYILLALVLTGAVHYQKFEHIGDPLAFIFEPENLNIGWMQFLVSLCAVIAMTSVLLVFQMGQPRIWMSISRDGLLPKIFQKIHPRHKTPSFSTILTGFVVGIPILFTDKNFVLDFTSIGTLFAFVLVCGGVLLIPCRSKTSSGFHLPYINGRFIFPGIVFFCFIMVFVFYPHYFTDLTVFSLPKIDIDFIKENMSNQSLEIIQNALKEKENALYTYNISTMIFWILLVVISLLTIFNSYSLIPLLGLSTCLYLLTGMSMSNWIWFGSWLILGIIVYFCYGYHHSHLKK